MSAVAATVAAAARRDYDFEDDPIIAFAARTKAKAQALLDGMDEWHCPVSSGSDSDEDSSER
jgi:hypothetical protein